ncbi:YerC/YecD family TrpR-related protein [Miniphocaeibacter massiliensis]|uniref:YerC/YecD family TrpR-related protein n=1 Tax=Miniphocaeibacter massiliensis TaxID=2041841 RepID=UPI000C1B909A|nr:YerC/YecD family TrpR-related protein [Miniphocaeibacter massiliensis]
MTKESRLKSKQLDEFFDAVLMLKDKEDCYKFFEDVCTVRELHSITQRLEVAKLLKIRKTYNEIEKETGASTATISRVNRNLNYGAEGYELVLDELIARDLKRNREKKK